MINIVLFGPPGAGKGTQSEKIIERYGLSHLSTGDLFRKHLSEGTELGKTAKRYLDGGNLVPDQLVIDMVDAKMADTPDSKGFIFDGFPRTVTQAEALDRLLEKRHIPISGMIALEVAEEELRARLKNRGLTSGRPDDQDEDKINHRIRVYHQETVPVAEYYQKQGKYVPVKGSGGITEIFERISVVIDSF